MDIGSNPSVTGLSPDQARSAAPSEPSTGADISADFETFLRLMTTQMTNQDPMDPMKAEEFSVQLATFSGVEQQVQTNDLLRDLVAQMGASGLAQMAGWVGMEAKAVRPVAFDGASVDLVLPQPRFGDRHELVVTNSAGVVVERREVTGEAGPMTWAGRDNGDVPYPDGEYRFALESFGSDGTVADRRDVAVYGRVLEAQMGENGPQLVFPGGITAAPDGVSALRTPV
ncbi:flagellar basal body rod modification protein [Mesobaculum littorinae]|uniref:Basal-body rod modification protein FlgD n=1 Tax=Mesobaculum littorinae TaxID=2486419 RepID=A0A438AGW7_9RHOB|nr:flagellar hook capping FlgD N-terminal domain-containing protein [Mesobaculum littorinae]RVV97949.1 flagellar basal body rod modification protein [Mesobaculum littorinae]